MSMGLHREYIYITILEVLKKCSINSTYKIYNMYGIDYMVFKHFKF